MRYFFFFILILFLGACGISSHSEKGSSELIKEQELPPPYVLSDDKENFLDKVDLLHYPDEILIALEAEEISLKDIEAYCLKKDSTAREASLITAITSGFHNDLSEGNSDYWGGILYDMESYVSIINRLKSEKHKTFMDIGSGNGEKIYAAKCVGFEKGFGLEYAPELVNISKEFLQPYIANSTIKVQLGNALEIEGNYYGKADFLYMYSPIKSHETMAFLYERIMNNMKDGATLLEVRFVYAKEIRERTQLNFPEFSGVFAIEKVDGKFYYLRFDQEGIFEKILLEKIKPE